jgi:hypothetical protein
LVNPSPEPLLKASFSSIRGERNTICLARPISHSSFTLVVAGNGGGKRRNKRRKKEKKAT